MKYIVIAVLFCSFFFTSCTKEPTYDPSIKAELSVEFDNIVGADDLALNTATYTNASTETFKVTKLKYYVSNFVLTNVNGNVYTVPKDECYFLVDESDESTHEPILNIPEGEYKKISFVVGVDSLKSVAPTSEQTGNLDITTDMFWNANQGYIFFKMEGTHGATPFEYNVGGYGGSTSPTANNLKTITLDLTTRGTPKVKSGKETNIHLFVDILKVLNGTTNISFATTTGINTPSEGVVAANNYSTMFRHDHTEN